MIKEWTAALRGGKYNKGKVHLKIKKNGILYHCALGVLLEVIQYPWVELPRKEDIIYGVESPSGFHECSLPLGIIPANLETKIWEMNDRDDLSFEEIAYFLEKQN